MESDTRVKEQFTVFDKDNVACLYVDPYDEEITESMMKG